MEKDIKLIILDSCVYLNIILEDNLSISCNEIINKIKEDKEVRGAITPIIIEEVIRKIREHIEEDKLVKNSKIKLKGDKIKKEILNSNLSLFFNLIKDFDFLLPKNTKEYQQILYECFTLRLGYGRNDMDQINLSIAICNNCNKFITTEKNIYNERKKIKKISRNGMEIELINK